MQKNNPLNKRIRQYIGILAAIAAYYIIHEGAHLICAMCFGAFKEVKFMGLGMQIDVYAERLTDTQLGIFCLVGAVAALAAGWTLVLAAKRICKASSKLFKAVMWYVTQALLLLDPLYLSVLCGFFGGGDMNGIRLLIHEGVARAGFAVIGIFHGIVIWKYLLPEYKKAFQEE